jgi:hypothetical protein
VPPGRTTAAAPSLRPRGSIDDAGLLTSAQTSLLIDQYELAVAANDLRRDMDGPAAFELFARRLPAHRNWLLVAGLGPALALLQEMREPRTSRRSCSVDARPVVPR